MLSFDNLKMLSDEKPVLLVFLRHFGCVFCKEAMADLSKLKNEIIDFKKIVNYLTGRK